MNHPLLFLASGNSLPDLGYLRLRLFRSIIYFSISAFSAASLCQPPPPSTFDLAFVEIVKLDPNPVSENESFTSVVRITNRVSRSLVLKISQITEAIPARAEITLAPNEARIVELRGRFLSAGVKDVVVSASLQTDKMIKVFLPSGQLERRFVFESIGNRAAQITVYAKDAPPVRPVFVDLSPDKAQVKAGTDFSGVVETIIGAQDSLFAIPKTAGVWRSVNSAPWKHLPGSPPRAFSIAIDPNNSSRLAVGERADDNPADPQLGRSGLWESADFGNSWTYTYDPTPDASSQQIPAVAFSRTTSTLFVVTTKGVARRERSQTANPFDGRFSYGVPNKACVGPTELDHITALTVAETRVWARSPTHIFFSDDDGKTWACRALPPTVHIPGFPNLQPDFNTTSTGANDNASIGAFDDRAFLIFSSSTTTTVPRDDPRALDDKRCDPSDPQNIPTFNICVFSRSPLLIFDPSKPVGSEWIAQFTGDRDGRGENGRRFVKAYTINATKCPSLASRVIGAGRQLIYGSGQGIQQALSVAQDGRIVWDNVLLTEGGQFPQGKNIPVHSDMWDFHLPSDYCPSGKGKAFLATDGGIDVGELFGGISTRLASMLWSHRSEGLHVQTVQDILVVESSTVSAPIPGNPVIPIRHIAYPTQDNNGWWRNEDGSWANVNVTGDANYVAGDVAQPAAVIWRQLNAMKLDGTFDQSTNYAKFLSNFVSESAGQMPIMLSQNQALDGPTRIQAIQSLASEKLETGTVDMVMLVNLPLTTADGKPVADPKGSTGTGTRLALIRDTNFNKHPDGPNTSFANWTVEQDQLPQDTRRFWVAGGHANPQYYIYTGSLNADCPSGLQSRFRSGGRGETKFAWKCLTSNLVDVPITNDFVGQHGPVFVNPFDANVIVVAANTSSGGRGMLRISINSGKDFCDLPGLTALVTESGRYPIVGVFAPNSTFNDLGSRFAGYPFSVPSHISFYRHSPAQLLVASPYTSLYTGRLSPLGEASVKGNCTDPGWKEPSWNDLAPYVPTSRSYVSSTAIIGAAAIVSTAGRGIYAISNIRTAQMASYFDVASQGHAADPIARLRYGNGEALPWARVLVTVNDTNSRTLLMNQVQVRGGSDGRVNLPYALVPGEYIVDLKFVGDGAVSPAIVKYRMKIAL